MTKTLLVIGILLSGGLMRGQVLALDPIQIAPKIEKVIVLPSSTPTLAPIKLIKPTIKFDLVSTPKATATPNVVVVTATPTVTGTLTVTPEATETVSPTETIETAAPTSEVKELKEVTKETIPWYIMVTIGVLMGIIVVQAWPKKTE